MPVNKETFDQDLQAMLTAQTNYIAAVNAFLQLPPVIDLTSEDDSVKSAAQAIADAQAQLPPPPQP